MSKPTLEYPSLNWQDAIRKHQPTKMNISDKLIHVLKETMHKCLSTMKLKSDSLDSVIGTFY